MRYREVMALRAIVRNGRLQMDFPVDLPEGTEIELVTADESGALSEADLIRLNAAIDSGVASIDAGLGVDGFELIERLRAKS